jgi:hypothetical protein
MCSSRLNRPMVCSAAAEDDGEAPERRGEYGLDGVAMVAAPADQPGRVLGGCWPGLQLPAQMRIQRRREGVAHGLAAMCEDEDVRGRWYAAVLEVS